jgi:carbon storage regulator CsrA
MLILTRKKNEVIRIGEHIQIVVMEMNQYGQGRVRLGISAPKNVAIYDKKRQEKNP